MTVQDVVTAVSIDMRQVLADSGSDATLISRWVDRIQKDILYDSTYAHLAQSSTVFNTVVGTTSYTLPDSARDTLLVFDRTNNRHIPEWTEGLGPGEEGSAATTITTRPNYYIQESTGIFLFPALQADDFVSQIEVHYSLNVSTVSLTSTLTLPDDAFDIIVSGTNMLAASYLKNIEEAARWEARYLAGKNGK